MGNNRLRVSTARDGTRTVEDRRTGAWYLVKHGRIIDYGVKRATCLLHLGVLDHELSCGSVDGGD
jgi:hypothetical protein